jgi:hypothetical protein
MMRLDDRRASVNFHHDINLLQPIQGFLPRLA